MMILIVMLLSLKIKNMFLKENYKWIHKNVFFIKYGLTFCMLYFLYLVLYMLS